MFLNIPICKQSIGRTIWTIIYENFMMPSNTAFTRNFKLLKSSVVCVRIWNCWIIVQHIEKWYQAWSVLICSKICQRSRSEVMVRGHGKKNFTSGRSKIEAETFWADNHIHLMLSSKAFPIHRLLMIWKFSRILKFFRIDQNSVPGRKFLKFPNQSWIRCRCLEITRITNVNIPCFNLTNRVIRKFSNVTSELVKPPVLWIEENGILKVSLRDIKKVFCMEILGGHFVWPHKSIT